MSTSLHHPDPVLSAWMDGFSVPPRMNVDEWANASRVLTSVSASEAGRWSTARTPYLKEIMEALSPSSRMERVVLMKGAQHSEGFFAY